MKKTGHFQRLMAMMVAIVMILSLAACGANEPAGNSSTPTPSSSSQASATTTPEPQKEVITLKMLVTGTTVEDWNNGHESPVQLAIKEATGVILEQQSVSEDQFNVILAGGDLPDLVRYDQTKHGKALVEGNHLLPLDDLLQTNGQDILKNIPSTLEYSKINWSQGKNKIFGIPTQIGPDALSTGLNDSIAPVLRWDYYKELGCPEITDEYALLDILKQMVEKHPKTPEGKKVYGVSMWHDWGNWSYFMPLYYFSGYTNSIQSCAKSVEPGSKIVDATAADGPYWRAVKFYYTANRMGLLDPDALTMKYADFEAKATAGQILYGPASWPFAKFDEQNSQNGIGFMPIPVKNGYQWHGDMASLGWTSKIIGISSNTKNADRAMDLMNYLWSYDGCRTMYSGIEGVHWNMVDGKPVLTDETIAAYQKNDDAWKKTNIRIDLNIMGLSPYNIHPEDGEVLCLFYTKQVFSKDLNPLVKDYSDYYKVSYPGELFNKLVAEGKNKNKSAENPFANAYPYSPSDELKRIDADLQNLMAKHAAKCILAGNDEEYEKLKAEAIKEFEKAGSKQNFESRSKWYEEALKDAQKYAK